MRQFKDQLEITVNQEDSNVRLKSGAQQWNNSTARKLELCINFTAAGSRSGRFVCGSPVLELRVDVIAVDEYRSTDCQRWPKRHENQGLLQSLEDKEIYKASIGNCWLYRMVTLASVDILRNLSGWLRSSFLTPHRCELNWVSLSHGL